MTFHVLGVRSADARFRTNHFLSHVIRRVASVDCSDCPIAWSAGNYLHGHFLRCRNQYHSLDKKNKRKRIDHAPRISFQSINAMIHYENVIRANGCVYELKTSTWLTPSIASNLPQDIARANATLSWYFPLVTVTAVFRATKEVIKYLKKRGGFQKAVHFSAFATENIHSREIYRKPNNNMRIFSFIQGYSW